MEEVMYPSERISQIRNEFLEEIRLIVKYWYKQNQPEIEKLEGVAFSILVLIDGMAAMPPFDIIPHKCKEGLHFDGQLLHDLFYEKGVSNDKQD
jgi:hypothetical protein